jgi:uncharacterized damage-inducible protein DinB
MTEQAFPLITFYRGWENYQQSLVETIAPLTSEQLALPVTSHESIGGLLSHMIGARYFWFRVWMGEGNPELDQEDDEQPGYDAAELISMFEKTWEMIADALSRWTAADLEQVFSTPDSISEEERKFFPPRTRQWIIWHVLEHEIHHGGELSLALGGYGLTGVYGDF